MALLVRFVGLVILLATIAAALASFFYNKAQEADQASRVALQANVRLRDHVAVLEGVRALYQSDPESTGPGIRAYLAALQPQIHTPGMEGVGIAIAMRPGSPAAAEARLQASYGKPIAVWPASDQSIGFPIVLVEPDTPRRHNALGYDMYSDAIRREAMRRAWQTGRPAVSGIVQLVQEKGLSNKQPGFLIYVPVYTRLSATTSTPTDELHEASAAARPHRAREIEAFVYAPFRTHDLMKALLGSQIDAIEGLEIYAGDGPTAPLAFRHGKLGWDAHVQRLRVADHQWTMRISYGRFLDRLGRPLGIFLFGAALALFATQLHRVQRRRIDAFQALAEERARHAEDRELMICEMAHRMKNAFARIGALARITVREAKDLDDFEVKFDGRLSALSDAKQMLVTGAIDTVDLRQIIDRELVIAGWSSDQLAGVGGPEVRLDDDGAQALALTVHELVTNSVKYGALAGWGDLTVKWRHDGDDVILSWIESGLTETPQIEHESFGTHFIGSLIERQLKGCWDRSTSDHGLTITIRWPDIGGAMAPPD